jgi:putative membrane protein
MDLPYILVRYGHFLGILAVVSAVVAEHLMIKERLTRKEIKRLFIVDGIYGFGVILTLVCGFLLWFAVGKPAEFYSTNGLFHTKVTLFVIVGILSIAPTRFFWRERKGAPEEEVEVPKRLVMFLRLELLLLFIMPLLATIVASGFNL